MLGSAQLAGSHRGKWSPEAAGEALCPGELDPVPLSASSPSDARSAGLLLDLHADPVQPGVPRGDSSWKDILVQALPTRLAVGDPICPGIPVLLFDCGYRLGSDIHNSLILLVQVNLGVSLQGTFYPGLLDHP